MPAVEKVPLERLRDRGVNLSFECPRCRGARIEMRRPEDLDFWRGVRCPKCHAHLVLDSLSVTVILEEPAAPPA